MNNRRFEIRKDDLSSDATRALLALHLSEAHANSPPGSVFALDLHGLQGPEITVWTAWGEHGIMGVGALKAESGDAGEVKSMRTHPDHLGKGVATRLLDTIIGEARARGYRRLSLETGSNAAFGPALALYRRRGFMDGEAFSDYAPNGFSRFLHLPL